MTKPPTKAELAERLGVARSTLYNWLQVPGCPDPNDDLDGFLQFAEGMKSESRGSDLGRDSGALAGDLKQSKLKADTLLRWQQIRDYEDTMRSAIESEVWEDVQDFLAAYRQALERVGQRLPDADMQGLNAALSEAVDRVEKTADAANVFDQRLNQLRTVILTSTDPDG